MDTEKKEEGERPEVTEEGERTEDKDDTETIVKNVLETLLKGDNVFLTGSGGTGKSYITKKVFDRLESAGVKVEKTGSTGVAADNIKGRTLHSWAGIGLGDKQAHVYISELTFEKSKALKRWKTTRILIIDEISMIGAKLFQMLSEIGKTLRKNTKPFGGISLLLVGDMCQLPPVKDSYIFKSDAFKELNLAIIRLTKPWRFQKDLKFFELLQRIRLGEQTKEDIGLLRTRMNAYYKDVFNKKIILTEIRPTILYSKKMDVLNINMEELDKLDTEEYKYVSTDRAVKKHKEAKLRPELYSEIMGKICPSEISLKKGAQVMLTRNLDIEQGLCNGSRGVVVECLDNSIIVKFRNGIELNVEAQCWTYEDDDVSFTRAQMPLILAYAITIHKSQSATLDNVIVDLGTTLFSENMGYVALSRCRSLDDLYIVNIIPDKITCSKDAKEFEKAILTGK